jgi:3-deoxy-7-phosphoheptulonate synthase
MKTQLWTPDSWHNKVMQQTPVYTDAAKLQQSESRLARLPPLVFAGEVRSLKRKLAAVAEGKAFLFHGGEHAESFADFSANNIRDTLRIILQIAVILTYSGDMPVVKVGRMAGNFTTRPLDDFETQGNQKLLSYRGDIINDISFNQSAREPDPERMIRVYNQSAATLNLLRAFAQGGYADLNQAHNWNLDFVANSKQGKRYQELTGQIDKILRFMAAYDVNSETTPQIRETDLFASHEVLLLPYEQALTRIDSTTGDWYDVSAHMLWIDEHTQHPDGAYVEFLRGIKNPIGIKCGPSMKADDILCLIDILNPTNEPGRLTLTVGMGSDKIAANLPPLLRAVKHAGHKVVWCSDPMHSNIYTSSIGYKACSFDRIMKEVSDFFALCKTEGVWPGGIHLEMTGAEVKECTGSISIAAENGLSNHHEPHCSPRLNAMQVLDLAFLTADNLKKDTTLVLPTNVITPKSVTP